MTTTAAGKLARAIAGAAQTQSRQSGSTVAKGRATVMSFGSMTNNSGPGYPTTTELVGVQFNGQSVTVQAFILDNVYVEIGDVVEVITVDNQVIIIGKLSAAAPAWTQLNLQNGWLPVSGSEYPSWKLRSDGLLMIRGVLNPSGATSINVATLPTLVINHLTAPQIVGTFIIGGNSTGYYALLSNGVLELANFSGTVPGNTCWMNFVFDLS